MKRVDFAYFAGLNASQMLLVSRSALYLTLMLSVPAMSFSQTRSAIDLSTGAAFTHRQPEGAFASGASGNDAGRAGWNVGVHYSRHLGKRWYLRTGMEIATFGYKSPVFSDFRWGDQVNQDFVFDPNIPTQDPLAQVQYKYRQGFAGIPVLLRYQFKSRKLTTYLEGGLAPSIFLYGRNKQVTNLGTKAYQMQESPAFHKFRLQARIAYGVQYLLSPGYELFAQPALRYHLTNSGKYLSEHQYSIGLDAGVRKALK